MACRDVWNTWPSGLRSPQNPPASPSGFVVPGVPRAMYFTHHGKPWLKPTTKHSKAKTVCIFLGIYCMSVHSWVFLVSRGKFSLNNLPKTPHGSHTRARYGVSFVSSLSEQRFSCLSVVLPYISGYMRPQYMRVYSICVNIFVLFRISMPTTTFLNLI